MLNLYYFRNITEITMTWLVLSNSSIFTSFKGYSKLSVFLFFIFDCSFPFPNTFLPYLFSFCFWCISGTGLHKMSVMKSILGRITILFIWMHNYSVNYDSCCFICHLKAFRNKLSQVTHLTLLCYVLAIHTVKSRKL